jgi:AP-2 complex subunit alpha
MTGAPREAQQIFPIRLTSANEVDISRNTKIVAGNRVTVLKNVDPSPTNIVMAGVLHMSKQGKVYVSLDFDLREMTLMNSGILGRLEPNKDAKLCRLTIRSTNENVSKEFLHLLSQPLNADVAAS